MAALEEEVKTLSPDKQDRLAALLTVLRLKRGGGMKEIERRLNDESPDSWVNWEEAKRQLDLDS
ncbi:MAG: hypothetical protein AAGC74_03405 [Verrucomicrobiota bacterium]